VKPLVKLDLVFGTTNGARYGGLKRVLFDVVAGWLSVPSDRAEHARTPTLLMPFLLIHGFVFFTHIKAIEQPTSPLRLFPRLTTTFFGENNISTISCFGLVV
jgi:hypothetical protein